MLFKNSKIGDSVACEGIVKVFFVFFCVKAIP